MTADDFNMAELEGAMEEVRESLNIETLEIAMLSVAQFRSQAGRLRGGTEVKIVKYRGRSVAIATPHPLDYWQDATAFIGETIAERDRLLSPPFRTEAHPWVNELTGVKKGTMEQLRRGTAQVFAYVLRNTVYLFTYYEQYEVMSLLPVPDDTPPEAVQAIAQTIYRSIRLPQGESK